MINIKDKRAFLTGASRGIGQQIAIGLADLGCNLILHARNLDNLTATYDLLKDKGVDIDLVAAELTDPDQVASMLDKVDALNKQVDIVYNCAGISGADEAIYATDRANWDRIFQVNIHALVAICEHFAPKLIQQGFGRIVNVSSGVADQPNLIAYSISKAAVDRYTKDFAPTLKEGQVLINAIDPGWIRTDMGGPNAFEEVSSVLPGMLVPVLIDKDGPVGQRYSAQHYKGKAYEDIDYTYDGFTIQ